MTESLKIMQDLTGTLAKLKLTGQIDEDADYSGANFDKVTEIIFDFEKVTLINSTGLQKWISFLNKIPKKIKINFEKCTPKVIKQIDMFPGFVGNRPVSILSFYAPYFCENCNKAANVLLLPGDVLRQNRAPEMACPDCKKTMEFDAIEKKYFLFLDQISSAS